MWPRTTQPHCQIPITALGSATGNTCFNQCVPIQSRYVDQLCPRNYAVLGHFVNCLTAYVNRSIHVDLLQKP